MPPMPMPSAAAACVEHAAQALVGLLEEVDRYPLANPAHGPTDA